MHTRPRLECPEHREGRRSGIGIPEGMLARSGGRDERSAAKISESARAIETFQPFQERRVLLQLAQELVAFDALDHLAVGR